MVPEMPPWLKYFLKSLVCALRFFTLENCRNNIKRTDDKKVEIMKIIKNNLNKQNNQKLREKRDLYMHRISYILAYIMIMHSYILKTYFSQQDMSKREDMVKWSTLQFILASETPM